MPPSDEDLREAFSEIPEFLTHEGELARNGANRYRDFIIAKKHGDSDDISFSFGDVELPPESLDELQELVRKRVKVNAAALRDNRKRLCRYGEARDNREYIKYLTIEDFPMLERIEELFNERDIESTTYHEGIDPDFQAIRIRDHEDNMVVGLQHYWKNQLLGNTSLFNLYYNDEGHEPMDEPIISIPDRLDAVYYEDVLYIFNDWRFEQMFDYHKVYEEVAEDVIETVKENDIEFEDMDMVEDAILSNPIMMRKFDDVQRTGLYDMIDMDDIDWVITEYAREGIEVVEENGDQWIEVENRQNVWELIHILNDDHVESRLTERAYQATGGKKEI
ncbi:Kiwa anti-phage protein KwaB-like domain-containing protein [Natrialba aegyptia]|uniref:Kiwa anti-phage protein KwaB-like domain-containing protein n=1 Tax=Natrialba aegyptia TaxID=129789 RepID=UPI0009FF597B|nr:Kiwa anti-phage protein KwaB-like domain-containing protein [Natrialba aegyptia]